MREEIRRLVAQYARLPVDISKVGDDDDLFRLGMTSHATVSVMLALEDAFGLEFPERLLRRGTFESIGAMERTLRELAPAGEGTELDQRC
ncbi:MAG: acyl carrier protein [Acidimicrobiales bacterium]